MLKRIFDILGALTGLLVLAVPLALLALVVFREVIDDRPDKGYALVRNSLN